VLRNVIAAQIARTMAIQTPGATISQGGFGNMTSNSLSQVSGMFTVCSPATHLAVPRATPSIPSVAMKGTTFSRVITRPLTVPTIPPTRTPLANANEGDQPAWIASAVITPAARSLSQLRDRSTTNDDHRHTYRTDTIIQLRQDDAQVIGGSRRGSSSKSKDL
jgi:hypothetical protein